MASTLNASNSGAGGLISTADASGVLQLQSAGTTAVTIDTSQNVGIGTASPTAILQVNSTAAIVRPIVTATTGYTDWVVANTGGNIYFGIDNSAGGISGTAYGRHIYSDGAYPLDFFTNSTQRMRIDSAGNVLVTGTGGLGYGTGTGGTVTQLTSKSTAVTLNKITGRIITHNAALAASTTAQFAINNTLATTTDTIIVNVWESGISLDKYIATASPGGANGFFYIQLRNISAGSLSDAVHINYTIIKGSTS